MNMNNKTIEIEQRHYLNASAMKFDNRRVKVEQINDGGIGLVFKIIAKTEDEQQPCAKHEIIRGKVKVTKLRISREAAFALFHALGYQLSHPIEMPISEPEVQECDATKMSKEQNDGKQNSLLPTTNK